MLKYISAQLNNGIYFGAVSVFSVSRIGNKQPHAILITIEDNDGTHWTSDIIDFSFNNTETRADISKRILSLLSDKELLSKISESTGINQEWIDQYEFYHLMDSSLVKLKKGPLAENQKLISIEPAALKLVSINDD